MQATAQSWLVLTLTRSSTDLGIVVALQTLPVLLLGPYGGVVADRVDKRRLMVVLQSAMGIQALVLGLLTVLGTVTYVDICVLAVVLGLNNAFETPSRQSFAREMVGREELRNAVTLNSVTVNAARAVGPAMDKSALQPSPPAHRAAGQLSERLRYVARTREIAIPLAMRSLVPPGSARRTPARSTPCRADGSARA